MSVRLGVVGVGAMGSLHARVATNVSSADLRWISDPDERVRESVGSRYGIDAFEDPGSFRGVDAVIIASPTHTHAEWCLKAIGAGIPFLVEKPLSTDLSEVDKVAAAARAAAVPFAVGFVERFNPAIRTVDGIVEKPTHFRATRHSPYVDRIRTGVGGDLMIHDVDLALRLMKSEPVSVTASLSFVHPQSAAGAEDIAEAHILFAGGGIASISASRVAQRKLRTATVANLEMTAEIDLMRQDVTIYRHVLSASILKDQPGYLQETIMEIPQIRYRVEPLVGQLEHFIGLVRGDADPASEAAGALLSHQVLQAVRRSAADGVTVAIDLS